MILVSFFQPKRVILIWNSIPNRLQTMLSTLQCRHLRHWLPVFGECFRVLPKTSTIFSPIQPALQTMKPSHWAMQLQKRSYGPESPQAVGSKKQMINVTQESWSYLTSKTVSERMTHTVTVKGNKNWFWLWSLFQCPLLNTFNVSMLLIFFFF